MTHCVKVNILKAIIKHGLLSYQYYLIDFKHKYTKLYFKLIYTSLKQFVFTDSLYTKRVTYLTKKHTRYFFYKHQIENIKQILVLYKMY